MKNSSNVPATLEKFLQLRLPADFYMARLGRTLVVRAERLGGLVCPQVGVRRTSAIRRDVLSWYRS